ncbi:MAG: DUF5723 family protein [Bacteroidales bacterium]
MNRSISVIAGLGLLIMSGIPLHSQINNTLYFMQGIPQSSRINPANRPLGSFYIGIPGLAPVQVELNSSSFAYGDVVQHPAGDTWITPLHPQADRQAFLDLLKPLNYVVSDLGSALISAGFNTPVGFFSFDVTSRADGGVYYPGDLARLILDEAVENRTYNFDGTAIDLSAFDEISVNWAGELLPNLQVGARAKMLFGIANLTTVKSEMELTLSQDVYRIQSDMLFNASIPIAEIQYDQEGNVDDIILKEGVKNGDPRELPKYMFNTRNLGMGVDIGVNYRPIDRLLLSASVTDVGFIRWKDEVYEAAFNLSLDYNEIEGDPFDAPDGITLGNYLDSLADVAFDSVTSALTVTPDNPYTTSLNTKLFIGANYHITPYLGLGLLSRTDFLQDKIAQQFTASANLTTGRLFNFTLSYSYINSDFKNIGAGLALNLGPVNLYLISDNALNMIFWREDTRSANLWFGMNLIFGYRNVNKDRPLVY